MTPDEAIRLLAEIDTDDPREAEEQVFDVLIFVVPREVRQAAVEAIAAANARRVAR